MDANAQAKLDQCFSTGQTECQKVAKTIDDAGFAVGLAGDAVRSALDRRSINDRAWLMGCAAAYLVRARAITKKG